MMGPGRTSAASARTRWIARVDAVLGPGFRRHDADELRRARLILSTNLLLASCAFGLVGLLVAFDWGAVFIPSSVCAGAILVANTWMMRQTGRQDLAALTLCLVVLAAIVAASWLQGGLSNRVLSWTLLVAMFAPMLMGWRLARVCIALVIVHVVTLYVAERWGHPFPLLSHSSSRIVGSQILMTVFVGGFAWLWDRSRREALAARDSALASLEESREARVALVENINAVIFSVDRDLRLIAGNTLFEQLSHRRGEPPIEPGEPVLDGLGDTQNADLQALFARALAGEHVVVERSLELGVGPVECEILLNPIRRASGEVRGVAVFARDISQRRRAQEELNRVNRELAHSAHLAGKAEVATDVLHNVGNVLTALNGSANLVLERLQTSKVPFLGKTMALLPATPDELGRFFATDAKGRKIREYLGMLGDILEHERAEMTAEMRSLDHQLEHVKSIVARQQAFAHTGGVVEVVQIDTMLAETLGMSSMSLQRHAIEVVTEVAELPPLRLDRHKLIEILTNFIANSRQALNATTTDRKRIVMRAFCNDQGKLQIDVVDNGVGIAREHLGRLFSYGFTTKRDGHGFGLAGSLLAARSIGGIARGHSDGPGKGATFTVELPFQPATTAPRQEHAA
jgi:PAS domain S-box-containing protein